MEICKNATVLFSSLKCYGMGKFPYSGKYKNVKITIKFFSVTCLRANNKFTYGMKYLLMLI